MTQLPLLALELPATYTAYSYGYPHKSSYRPLRPPAPLAEVWRHERTDALFLYVHVPFCEMRCGFCNLFTQARPPVELVDGYLAALERQAGVVRAVLPRAAIARWAIGGGTPTFLTPGQLERLFGVLAGIWGLEPRFVPGSVETSPATADEARLGILKERGVSRVSVGVQSFREAEARALGRPQQRAAVYAALDRLRALGFPTLNIDLIYGAEQQTASAWLYSLREALRFAPEELFLYPLYVRPQTGLGRRERLPSDHRLDLYRRGRDFLLAAGYEQVSMRCFRRGDAAAGDGPAYCCQRDGMVGLGCGARSYTTRLHYAAPFAVSAAAVQSLLSDWVAQTPQDFAQASFGIRLSEEERRRRFIIQSLLQVSGLDLTDYERTFGTGAVDDVPALGRLLDVGLAEAWGEGLRLTETGLEQSDAIGPALYSPEARRALEEFAPP
jgi:oxygen-independent coproporphyrinogen-3 oxidase